MILDKFPKYFGAALVGVVLELGAPEEVAAAKILAASKGLIRVAKKGGKWVLGIFRQERRRERNYLRLETEAAALIAELNKLRKAGKVIGGPLSNEAKDILRQSARDIWQARSGKKAIWDALQVHHRIPLEWAHLFPKADPNRIANLVGMNNANHSLATNAWNAWRRSLGGRTPSPAEVLEQALQIDKAYGKHMIFLP